jgi:hypothetical protein
MKSIAYALAGVLVALILGASVTAEEIPPEKAKEKFGQEVVVKMTVKAAKNRLEKKGMIYLDSSLDFNSPDNLAVIIKQEGADSFRAKGINDPAAHFLNKEVIVRGVVVKDEEQTRIIVTKAEQIELVEQKK